MSVGPFAVVSLLVATAASKVVSPDEIAKYVQVSLTLCLLVGITLLIGGLLRMGWIVNFISLPVLNAFTTASGLIIGSSQLASLFGITAEKSSVFYMTIINFFKKRIQDHRK